MSSRNYKWLSKPENFICKIYSKQKSKSIERGHLPPLYTLQELRDYAMSSDTYIRLFNLYLASGRNKDLAPSIDRLDDSKGYSFDNIQIITWKENKDNFTSSISKEIIYTDFNGKDTRFKSVAEASRVLNVSRTGTINALNVGAKTKIGYFKRV